jgi:RNA polymerase sigma-70 factor (ECF subfamily)
VVLAAGDSAAPDAAEALEQLCSIYWYPLYAYVRRTGLSRHDAEDLTQSFFERLLEKRRLQLAQRERGKFRTFLLSALKNFLANEWHRARAGKRGGGAPHLQVDLGEAEQLYQLECSDGVTAEKLYELSWATALLQRVRKRLRDQYAAEGKPERFAAAEQFLPGEESRRTYAEVAQELGIAEGTLKSDVHRLKQRFGDLLRAEIMHTVAGTDDVAEELRYLMKVLGG